MERPDDETVPIHPDLVWDYEVPPRSLLWRLQRIADAFPAYGRDRRTVRALFEHRNELRMPPEVRLLIEMYEEFWTEREEADHGGATDPPERRPGEVPVDSLRDILANKLSCLVERAEPKDFADVLFLLRRPELTLAQGMDDCELKFRWPGLRFLLQTAFLRIERVAPDEWPVTAPPVTLDEARRFFRDLVRSLIAANP